MRSWLIAAVPVVLMSLSGGVHALTLQECSAKYKAAQAANTLNGQKWNDFRKAQCSEASAPAAAAPAAAAPAAAAPAVPAPKQASAPATGAPANAVFPTAVAQKYAGETPGKARMHTCLDQYNANKTGGGAGNGGLEWIQKGGGYYSLCNKRLKG